MPAARRFDPSRRDFVEQALAFAGAALAGSSARGAADIAASPAAGPADTVRVAVIGCNGQGGNHITEWLAAPDVELVAVCDCDPAAYDKQAKQFEKLDRKPEYVQDLRRLLDRKDIDAVSIATPNHWHAVMAVWAMQAGKDVYIEKPCSHNVDEGRVITQWARRLGRMCQMGVQSRSMTGTRQLMEFVKSGKLGPVKAAHAVCYRLRDSIGLVDTPAPIPPGLDFDLWAGPAPKVVPIRKRLHYDWHWNRITGNGDLGNQNPHELDKCRWALGKQELPKRVVSLGGRLGYVDNGDVANSQVTIFQWDDAVLVSDVRGLPLKTPVTFGLKVRNPIEKAAAVIYGTEGFVVCPNYESGTAFDYDGHELGTWNGGRYQQHFANFVKAIKSRRHEDLHLDIEDGHLSSALAHLGNVSWALGEPVPRVGRPTLAADDPRVKASLDTFETYLADNAVDVSATRLLLGRELTIDPVTEKSTDAEANRLFTRDYRAGYELPRV
ncbi:MAG: Gfo/Idh/MocA family protein [Planctomycetaceae bacterium]